MAAGEEKVFEDESRSEFKLDVHLFSFKYFSSLRVYDFLSDSQDRTLSKTWSKGENAGLVKQSNNCNPGSLDVS